MLLHEESKLARFEQSVLPHLDAAYNLARWLTRDDDEAQDLVQETYLRAFKFFEGFRGENGRAWLLKILRNSFYTSLHSRARQPTALLDEELNDIPCESCDPETLALASADQQQLRQALEDLPVEYREVMVLRELEGLSYKEIAAIAGVPLGTVMSRLARARRRLQQNLLHPVYEEARVEL
jgi:RNA polymerase sigma factor (sigma-70 family)